MTMVHRELHIILNDTGHQPSSQCWCEPHIEETFDKEQKPMIVYIHNDFTPHRHDKVLHHREENPGWITRFLETLGEPNGEKSPD